MCDVDYDGPIYIKKGKRRNAKLVQAIHRLIRVFLNKHTHRIS